MSDLDQALQERDAARLDAARARAAAKHGLDPDDELLSGTDAATLDRQAARLAEIDRTPAPLTNHVPAEGTNPRPVPSGDTALRGFVRDLFNSGT